MYFSTVTNSMISCANVNGTHILACVMEGEYWLCMYFGMIECLCFVNMTLWKWRRILKTKDVSTLWLNFEICKLLQSLEEQRFKIYDVGSWMLLDKMSNSLPLDIELQFPASMPPHNLTLSQLLPFSGHRFCWSSLFYFIPPFSLGAPAELINQVISTSKICNTIEHWQGLAKEESASFDYNPP